MKRSEPNYQANKYVARAVPLLVVGMMAYASWVLTKLICVDYLLRPQSQVYLQPRRGAGIAILTIHYLLLFIAVVCYGRLAFVVSLNPGFVKRGPQFYAERERQRSGKKLEKTDSISSDTLERSMLPVDLETISMDEKQLQVEEFWKRDVFVCNFDGRPKFCSSCRNWKPDRSHHCKEVNRCVLKMDHFCPWVGGVVGETSFKYFIQFTFWAALDCLHLLVSDAVYFAQRRRVFGLVNVNWAVLLGIAGLMFIFAGGMCASSLQFAFTNSTTIENLNRKRQVWYLAIHIPENRLRKVERASRDQLRLITYPRPLSERQQILGAGERYSPGPTSQHSNTVQDQASPTANGLSSAPLRTFGIFETRAGSNPWDLGAFNNFQDLMGYTLWEWLLPIRSSPLANHDSTDSFYKTGIVVDQIKREVGITRTSSNLEK